MDQKTLNFGSYFFNRPFLATLFSLALPISIQQTLTASLQLIDVAMVGQLGDLPLATVGLVGKLFFISSHVLVGLASGTGVLSAQYFGKGDTAGCRRVLAIALSISLGIALPFSLATWLMPEAIMGMMSDNPQIVALGTTYMRITAPYHVITSIVMAYAAASRSIKRPKLAMIAGVVGIALNTGLNYLLIFGHGGFEAMGVAGAAYATVIARLAECVVLVAGIYAYRMPIVFKSAGDFLQSLSKQELFRLMRPTLPIIGGEYLWSMGIFCYYMIYGRMGTQALAAMSMLEPLEGVFIQFFLGFGTACSILLGNDLGADKKEEAYNKSLALLLAIPFAGLVAGLVMVSFREPMLGAFHHLEPATKDMASDLFVIMGATLSVKIFNMLSMFGILRSGGDTRYMMFIDFCCMWGIGVPLALMGAFVFHFPLRLVYLMVLIEELVKAYWSFRRIKGGRWLNNLVGS